MFFAAFALYILRTLRFYSYSKQKAKQNKRKTSQNSDQIFQLCSNIFKSLTEAGVLFSWEIKFSDKISLKKVSEPFISIQYNGKRNLGAKTDFYNKPSLHVETI